MRTITMLITMTYDDKIWHGGDDNLDAKDWFFTDILNDEKGLSLWSNEAGDEIGEVKIIWQKVDSEE